MQSLQTEITGHVLITDDNNRVLLDDTNAIHPINMARLIARGLSNEHNSFIDSMAFGNGGTESDVGGTITVKTTNDGFAPDVTGYASRLYNETYREIVNEGKDILNVSLGTDPGSSEASGIRTGGGSATGDGTSTIHVSGPGVRSEEKETFSEVIVTCVLNKDEPKGQLTTSQNAPVDNSFKFDEIGLYSTGLQPVASYGYVSYSASTSINQSTLIPLVTGTPYTFKLKVDANPEVTITLTPPGNATNTYTYKHLCDALNTGDVAWNASWNGSPLNGAVFSIDGLAENGGVAVTNGNLIIKTISVGSSSSVVIATGPTNDLFATIGGTLQPGVIGAAAGIQDNAVAHATEVERLLTHIIFDPVTKSADRTLTIKYTLTVSVKRTTTSTTTTTS